MNEFGGRLLRCTCRPGMWTTPRLLDNATRQTRHRLYSVKEKREESIQSPPRSKKPLSLPTTYVPQELSSKDVSQLAHKCMQLLHYQANP